MKEAVQDGYLEPLAWFGSRRSEPEKWWIPEIDKGGFTNVEGGIDINFIKLKNIKLIREKGIEGIRLNGTKYEIYHVRSGPESNFIDRGGLFSSESSSDDLSTSLPTMIINGERVSYSSFFNVSKNKKALERLKAGDILIIPEQQWKRRYDNDESCYEFIKEVLGILIPGKNNKHCPIDIVTLTGNQPHKEWEKELIIDITLQKINCPFYSKKNNLDNA